jgi:hypothetical protein
VPPRTIDAILRVEWLAVAVAVLAAYAWSGASWPLFFLLILVPDLSMLFYLAGPRAGAVAYNAFHVLVWPALLMIGGLVLQRGLLVDLAAIWTVHVAIDRALGYGLKLPGGFGETHLGRIGRRAASPAD